MKGCPNCKDATRLATIEEILGSAGCEVSDDGEINHDGYTEVHWDTSTTTGIECRSCGWSDSGEDYMDRLIVVTDWAVVAEDGSLLDRFEDEHEAHEALLTGEYPEDASVAYVSDPT
jgi:hypothetical protein